MPEPSDLKTLLEGFLGEPVEDLVRLPGGASRETWSLRAGARQLILRRDPPRAHTSGRAMEYELLKRCADAGVPVPRVIAYSDDAFGGPGFLMEHVEGETIARRILRDDEYAAARTVMAAQCGEILARIHTVDPSGLFEAPVGNPALAELAKYRMALDSFGEPHPALELAIRWLERRPPKPGRVGLVHGDFRNGNLIVGPDGVRAVLDWELAHAGDPWEDLGWLCIRSWRFGGPGEVGGFGDREDLYAAYETASGIAVDADAVRWWEVYGSFKWGISTLAQTFTHLSGRVRSVELAAIGRRTCETEYDVLRAIS